MDDTLDDLRYPTGPFTAQPELSSEDRTAMVDEIAALPSLMREVASGLSDEQLDTPYRPGGWTLRQVVHHVPDSHMNCYIRFKWALTEDRPMIKAYFEDRWAEAEEAKTGDIEMSLTLLEALHIRLVTVMRNLTDAEWARELNHPEIEGPLSLTHMLQLYAWHGRHHVGHIRSLRDRMGW